jgi:hypothetical protein
MDAIASFPTSEMCKQALNIPVGLQGKGKDGKYELGLTSMGVFPCSLQLGRG